MIFQWKIRNLLISKNRIKQIHDVSLTNFALSNAKSIMLFLLLNEKLFLQNLLLCVRVNMFYTLVNYRHKEFHIFYLLIMYEKIKTDIVTK
jgi:hypothetical protein